jgi:hypothetical protein
MAKELKWFKFNPASWMMGRIVREPDNIQANFIRLCCQYWFNQCEYSHEEALLECGDEVIEHLTSKKFITVIDGYVKIDFLEEQRADIEEVSNIRAKAANERWSKQDNASALQDNASAYNKDKDKDKEEDKNKNIPTKKVCLMKNSGVTIENIKEAFINTDDLKNANYKHYFQAVYDWSDSKGEMRKDWIATVRGWARRDLADGKLKLKTTVTAAPTNHATPPPDDFGKVSPTAVTMPESLRKKMREIGTL